MNIRELRQAHRKYFQAFPTENSLSVTLSLKQRRYGQIVDDARASDSLKHTLNVLNKRHFGNAAARFGKRFIVIPALERPRYGRWHYHLALHYEDISRRDSVEKDILELWPRSRFGYRHNKVGDVYDGGWTEYITKLLNFDDSIDYINLNI